MASMNATALLYKPGQPDHAFVTPQSCITIQLLSKMFYLVVSCAKTQSCDDLTNQLLRLSMGPHV